MKDSMEGLRLVDVLRDQKQCDPDGVYCIVNRQAVDEAISLLEKPSNLPPPEAT